MNFQETIWGYIKSLAIYVDTYQLLFLGIMIVLLILLCVSFLSYGENNSKKTASQQPRKVITSKDIAAIAGEDVMTTELDLARAYIEIDNKKLAKEILDHVIKQGNAVQQQQARELINSL